MPNRELTPDELAAIAAFEMLAYEPNRKPIQKKKEEPDPGWTPDLNPSQVKIFHDNAPFIMAYGEKGCRDVATMIYTADGLMRLGRMAPSAAKPGFNTIQQPIMAAPGKRAEADGYWMKTDKDAIRAHLDHGADVVGSPIHPLWVCWQSPSGSSGFGWQKLDFMKAMKAEGWRFWTPLFGHDSWTTGKRTMTDDTAYAVGALIGDGSLNFDGDGRSVAFTNPDKECVSRTHRGLADIGAGLSPHTDPIQFGVVPAGVIKPFLISIGAVGLSYDKRIPDSIIEGPKSCAAAFLRGLFDTDGTVCKQGTVSFCTTSEQLGRDVQDMLVAFGILCVRRPRKSASGRPTWTLSIMGRHAYEFGRVIGFEIKRKQIRIRKPAPSLRCPEGFNGNYYGYPDPIRDAMRRIAHASRTSFRTRRIKVRYTKRVGPRKTSWYLSLKAPWGMMFDVVNSQEEARIKEAAIQKRIDEHNQTVVRSREWHSETRKLHSFGSIPQRSKVQKFCELYNCHDKLAEFIVSDVWSEIVSLEGTTAELADLHVPVHHSFLAAGTLNHNSGKSIGLEHKLVRHCYENWDALGLIITPSIRTGKFGVIHDLETLVLPAWEEGIGLDWIPSKLDPNTKDRVLKIGNQHGGWSTILQISIPYEEAIASRIKGIHPSFVLADELTDCDGRGYFTLVSAQMNRRRNIQGPQQYTASCNPKGPSSWVYQVFIEEPIDPKTGERDSNFSVYHVPFSENAHRPEMKGYLETLERAMKNDPIERARLIEGKWIERPTGEALFRNHFIIERHVIGSAKDNTGLVPMRGYPCIVGYDLGQVYSAAVFMQLVPTENGNVWIVFDEVIHLNEKILYRNMAAEIVERILDWNKALSAKLPWVHLADDAAVNQWRPGGSGSFDSWEMEREFNRAALLHGLAEMRIKGVPKGPGSVSSRVRLVQGLLTNDSLLVSATCPATRDMLLMIEGCKDDALKPKRTSAGHIHVFDAMSYPVLFNELGGSISNSTVAPVARMITMGSGS